MPTVLRKDGFDVRIYFNDHLPPHVHVFKSNGQVRIGLGDDIKKPEVIEVNKLSNKEVSKALKIVSEYQTELLQKWREIHG